MPPMNSYSYFSRRLKTYLELQKQVVKQHHEQGFSIIESLMALIVVTIIGVAITPPIFIAVATRVQNQRAGQAMQLAQRQVDKIRILSEKGRYDTSDLPPLPSGSDADKDAKDVGVPTSFITSCPSAASSDACPVDVNGDNRTDFFVQTFRTKQKIYGTSAQVVAFQMGVRVYAAVAQGQSGLKTTQASLKFTTEQGNQRKYPLAVMYTAVVRSDLKDSLTEYKSFLCAGSTTPPCP